MTQVKAPATREDVLDAFAVELDTGRVTLERYLTTYPQFAAELVDLSRELSRTIVENEKPLSNEEQAMLDNAWARHVRAGSPVAVDTLTALSVEEQRAIADRLGVPRQVVTAFRERKVIVASVPRRFAGRFAAEVKCNIEPFLAALALSPAPGQARTYKADEKPDANERVTFERILIDAGVPEQKRAELISDGD
jgi:hypothetical protein